MPTDMTPACAKVLSDVRRRALRAHLRAALRPRAERDRFIYDQTFHNDIEAVAFFLAEKTGEIPDFATPKTYTEKLRGQFLTHPNPLMAIAADKVAMRDYCALFDLPIQPPRLLAVHDSPHTLDPRDLPEAAMIKISDGCAMNLLHSPKTPVTRRRYRRFLRTFWHIDHWRRHAELHYRDIPKRLLVEEALLPAEDIPQLGVYCVTGTPYMIFAPPSRMAALRPELAPLERQNGRVSTPLSDLASPEELERMLDTARKLSAALFHCRVDFMRVGGRLYLGEITLSPRGHHDWLEPFALERMRGDLLDMSRLPEYVEKGRTIAKALNLSPDTSYGHFAGDPRLTTAGQ